jgi:diadenosine tetraphosphate (Ap4A) HIT family hydrolase
MSKECLICERIEQIKKNKNPYFVCELETGYVVIGDHQFYKGYTVFLCKQHVSELHELDAETRNKFLSEMADVAAAVFRAFEPEKMNYELLGNTDRHLHWHLFPRRSTDPLAYTAVWAVDKAIRSADNTVPNPNELEELKQKLKHELK